MIVINLLKCFLVYVKSVVVACLYCTWLSVDYQQRKHSTAVKVTLHFYGQQLLHSFTDEDDLRYCFPEIVKWLTKGIFNISTILDNHYYFN